MVVIMWFLIENFLTKNSKASQLDTNDWYKVPIEHRLNMLTSQDTWLEFKDYMNQHMKCRWYIDDEWIEAYGSEFWGSSNSVNFCFESKDDAMLFKLVWI
jgi:hypothetical protein